MLPHSKFPDPGGLLGTKEVVCVLLLVKQEKEGKGERTKEEER